MNQPDFDSDMSEMLQNASNSEVVCVILPIINQCLVLDSRSMDDDPPTLVVSPASWVPPSAACGTSISSARTCATRASWPSSLGSAPSRAWRAPRVWDMMVRRMVDSGFSSAAAQCDSAMNELKQWERQALVAMIKGKGPFHTLWSRSGAR